jgi:hypothetical protein
MKRLATAMCALGMVACLPFLSDFAACAARTFSSEPAVSSGSAPPPAPDLTRLLNIVHHLSVFIGPRPSGSSEHREAVDWIADQLEAAGYKVEYDDFLLPGFRDIGTGVSQSVIARLEGTGPAPRPFVCVGGHLDSVRGSPGADDNASGVAVLLEAARLLRNTRFPFDIVWVAFGSEERYGPDRVNRHLGSRSLAERWRGEGRLPIAMMSIDEVGVGSGLRVRTRGLAPDWYWKHVLSAANRFQPSARYAQDQGPFAWSDHERFEDLGVPVAWLERRPNTRVHTQDDRFETVRGEHLVEMTKIVVEQFRELEKAIGAQ